MKIKMYRDEVLVLWTGLHMAQNYDGKIPQKLAYAVHKTLRYLRDEVESLEAARVYKGDAKKFDDDRIALARSHAAKDDSGNPVVVNGSFDLSKTQSLFDTAFEQMKLDKADLYKAYQDVEEGYKKLLKEKIEVEVFSVPADLIPDTLEARISVRLSALIE